MLMMPFFNRTELECVGVVGPEPGLMWTGLKALDRRARDRTAAGLVCRLCAWLFYSKRTRKKKGRQGLRPWQLRCLSRFLSKRNDRLLRG